MLKEQIEKKLGVKLGDIVWHVTSTDSGVVTGFDVVIDSSGEQLLIAVSFSPSVKGVFRPEEITTTQMF